VEEEEVVVVVVVVGSGGWFVAGCAASFVVLLTRFSRDQIFFFVKEARGARHKCSTVVAIKKNNYYRGWLAPAGVLGAHLSARKGRKTIVVINFLASL
jgi:hypothetical protein